MPFMGELFGAAGETPDGLRSPPGERDRFLTRPSQ